MGLGFRVVQLFWGSGFSIGAQSLEFVLSGVGAKGKYSKGIRATV